MTSNISESNEGERFQFSHGYLAKFIKTNQNDITLLLTQVGMEGKCSDRWSHKMLTVVLLIKILETMI